MKVETETAQALQNKLLRQLLANPHLHAYAVLDGASNPALLDHLYADEQPEFACLYRGELEPDIAECAPYLVLLEQNSAFTDWLTGDGWGLHWGVYALAECDLKTLRYHLRKLNMIYEPETHKPLLFRYYDPRVLSVFLPTCLPKQVNDFFGPVHSWLAERKDGAAMQLFARDEQNQIVSNEL